MKEGEEKKEEESTAPTYDFRINTAKILVELEEHERASLVLEMLLGEDDEVVEVWYLLGYVYVLMKERKSAEGTLKRAGKVTPHFCDNSRIFGQNVYNLTLFVCILDQIFAKMNYQDEGIFQHIQELLEECKTFEYKPGEDVPDEDDDDDDNMQGGDDEDDGDWEDADSDQDENGDVEMAN